MTTPPTAHPPIAPPVDPLLQEFLRQRDAPCPVCSYNLRGITAPVCPECAAPLRLQVGSEQTLAPWLAALISPALALGFDGVVTVLMSVILVVEPPRGRGQIQMAALLYGSFVTLAAASAGAAILILRRRRAWHRAPVRTQWRNAAIIFLSVFFVHAIFGLSLRFWL